MSEQTSAPRESKEERREGRGRGRGRAGRDEPDSEAQGMDFEELEPRAPKPALNPVGADITPVEIFAYDDEDDVDPVERSLVTNVDYEADEVDNFEGELLRSLQTAGGPGGVVVALNGNAYVMSAQQAGVLTRHLQRAASAAY
jgi:hypothetical protein